MCPRECSVHELVIHTEKIRQRIMCEYCFRLSSYSKIFEFLQSRQKAGSCLIALFRPCHSIGVYKPAILAHRRPIARDLIESVFSRLIQKRARLWTVRWVKIECIANLDEHITIKLMGRIACAFPYDLLAQRMESSNMYNTWIWV